jgi:hypothetical protein
MPRVFKYYKQEPEKVQPDDEEKVVALGIPDDSDCDGSDEELLAAKAYMKSVREESRKLPFAVVADTTANALQVYDRPFVSSEADNTPGDNPQELREAIIEYFVSLRMLLKKDGVEKQEKVIDLCSDCCDTLASADFVSISNAIEDLSELLDELSVVTVSEWLFGLLIYLDEPLLEDTAAALQILRRFCSRHPENCHLQICSLIVRFYFNQR